MKVNRKNLYMLGIVFVAISICILSGWYVHHEIDELANYDPKDAAYNRVLRTLDATYENPTTAPYQQAVSSCGGVWLAESCWNLLQDEVKRCSNEYDINVVFYNWEDEETPWRGGDEIIIEIAFSNGNVVNVYTYESCIDYCSYK